MIGGVDVVVAPDVVVPGGLLHEEGAAVDFVDGGEAVGEEAGGLEHEAVLVGEFGEVVVGGVFEGDAFGGEVDGGAGNFDGGEGGEFVIDP